MKNLLDLDLVRISSVLDSYSTLLHQHWLIPDGSQFKGHLTLTLKRICYGKMCKSFHTEPLQSEHFFVFVFSCSGVIQQIHIILFIFSLLKKRTV